MIRTLLRVVAAVQLASSVWASPLADLVTRGAVNLPDGAFENGLAFGLPEGELIQELEAARLIAPGPDLEVEYDFVEDALVGIRVRSKTMDGTRRLFSDLRNSRHRDFSLLEVYEDFSTLTDRAVVRWTPDRPEPPVASMGGGVLAIRVREQVPEQASAQRPAQFSEAPIGADVELETLLREGRFRGLRLGSVPASREGLQRSGGSDAAPIFTRWGDERLIEGLVLEKISYVFDGEQLSVVALQANGELEAEDLAKALVDILGNPTSKDSKMGEATWRTPRTLVSVRLVPQRAETIVVVRSATRAGGEDEDVAGKPCSERPKPFTWDREVGRCRAGDGKFALNECCAGK